MVFCGTNEIRNRAESSPFGKVDQSRGKLPSMLRTAISDQQSGQGSAAMNTVNLADAKAHLSELVAQAALRGSRVHYPPRQAGCPPDWRTHLPRRPVALATLQTLTESMLVQAEFPPVILSARCAMATGIDALSRYLAAGRRTHQRSRHGAHTDLAQRAEP